jgi:hypothetical protein
MTILMGTSLSPAHWCRRLYVIAKCKALKVLDFKKVGWQAGLQHTCLTAGVRSGLAFLCIMLILLYQQVKQKEREEAVKMFPTDEAAAQHSAKTFEVDADYEAQTAALQQQQAQEAAAAASAASEAAAGAKSKGPSQQELVAIKAAIANATVRPGRCSRVPDG